MEKDYIEKIKELRIDNDLTQVELSKKIGLSPAAYGLYETRQRHMDIETFVRICKLFDVSADFLLNLPLKDIQTAKK